jgi:quinol monooxygenase YgiN
MRRSSGAGLRSIVFQALAARAGGSRAMRLSHLVLSFAALVLAARSPLHAEDTVNTPVYVVTYFEVAPAAAAQTAGLAGKYAATSRKEPGNAAFDMFEEIGRPNRFAFFEAWRDKNALDAHNASTSGTAFHNELQPLMVSPFSVRSFSGLSVAAPSGSGGADALYVLTHVDVFPTFKDQAVELVKALAEAGRKDDGNLLFDVLQWDGHANHFTLIEAWRDRKAFDANVLGAHTKEFRQKLTPLEGALYDERLYQAVR